MSLTNKPRLSQLASLIGSIGVTLALFLPLAQQSLSPFGSTSAASAAQTVHLALIADSDVSQSWIPTTQTSHRTVDGDAAERPDVAESHDLIDRGDDYLQPGSDHGNYLPASQLTERPLILIDIDPELSARFAFIHPQSIDLVLLINDYGDVDRVLIPDVQSTAGTAETLPATLLQDLAQRFLQTRFSPGRLLGQPVRSALRIRVSLKP